MSIPVCERCKKDLNDWSANVVVDGNKYPQVIDNLIILCKQCTNEFDAEGPGRKLHNIWELSWVKKNANGIKQEIEEAVQNKRRVWSDKALEQFNELYRMATQK